MGTKCCKFDVCSNKVCRTEPFYNLISSCMFMSLKIWTAWVQFFFFLYGKEWAREGMGYFRTPPTPTPHEPQPCLKQEELIYSGVLLQNRKPCPAPSNRGFWRHKSRQRSKQQRVWYSGPIHFSYTVYKWRSWNRSAPWKLLLLL